MGDPRRDVPLLVQGPLALARSASSQRTFRIDAAMLAASDPPTPARLTTWIDQWVHVEGRPEWTFVKLHAHGAPEANAAMMLGPPMDLLHTALSHRSVSAGWQVHYVTAREMYNVARAAMDGARGTPAAYFDYEVPPPPRAPRAGWGIRGVVDRNRGATPPAVDRPPFGLR